MQNNEKNQDRSRKLEEKCKKYVLEITRLESQNSRLQTQIAQLNIQLRQVNGVKHNVSILYKELDRIILREIDRRGYRPRKSYSKIEVDLFNIEGSSKDRLLEAAREHDVTRYFQLHSPKSGMKLRYRIASKTYRISRDITKKTAKKSYHVLKSKKN